MAYDCQYAYGVPMAREESSVEPAAPVLPARDRRRARLLDHVERTALELFARRGYDQVTVEEIADAADISPRTFFRYFPTKQALLVRGQERQAARVAEAMAARPRAESAFVALSCALIDISEQSTEASQRSTLLAATAAMTAPGLASVEYSDRLVEALRVQTRQRLGRAAATDVGVEVVIRATIATAHHAFATWVAAEGRADLTALLQEAFAALRLLGLPDDRGRRP